jgi:penicillin-binding protein 2
MPSRLVLLALLVTLGGGAFLVRLFQLQVLEGSLHAQAVERALVVVEPLPARRGRILDRTGVAIAETRPMYHLSVVLAELEVVGRARREQDLWRLDRRRFDGLVGDLTTRLRWINRERNLKEVLLEEMLAHPGTAQRLGARSEGEALQLVAVDRAALAPGRGDEDAVRRLVEGDLLWEDPLDAMAREISARWGIATEVVTEQGFAAACAEVDRELDLGSEHSATVFEPFTDRCAVVFPLGGGREERLDLRLLLAERRDQAEVTLARVVGREVEVVRERLTRALLRAKRAAPEASVYFAASTDADQVAPLLPLETRLVEVPLPGVVGARERVLILQGDPAGDEGMLTQLCRRIAASLGTGDPGLLQALIEHHSERIGPGLSGREHRLYHVVLDPVAIGRLVAGLSERLSASGIPTTALQMERRLAEVRRLAERELSGRTRRDPLPLVRDVPHAVAVRLCGSGAQPPDSLRRQYDGAEAALPGLSVAVDVGRAYPFPRSAPHLIGMLARSDDGTGTLRGASGLELRYDDILRGSPGGRIRARTPDGFVALRDAEPLPGTDLVTELDMELQMLAEDSLDRYIELAEELDPDGNTERMRNAFKVGKGRGGFCLIDCRTGGILALASNPTFDLAEVAEKYQDMLKDPRQPLIDHAAVAEMPPGSSFKILTALCALEHGLMVPGENVWCQGYMAMSRGKPVLRDHAPAGTYDLAEAIQISSNVYFAIMADRVAKRLGPGVLPAYAHKVGIGWANALDVPSQRVGRMAMPTPDNIADIRPREPRWYPNDTWRMGIGQNCQASPLNVAPIAAAVANGGHVVRPFLVRPDSGPVITDLAIRQAFLDDVRSGMERVTANLPGATAKRLQLEGEAAGIKVAAKTGTAEWGSPDSRASGRTPDHAWLIGYAPADNPTVAFAVYIHSGTFGGKACVPVAKRVLERYFAKYGKVGHPPAGTPVTGSGAW